MDIQPINGKVPDVFHEWGTGDQVAYLRRFWHTLGPTYKACLTTGHDQRPCANENCLMRDVPPEAMMALIKVD